jgi:hypothetical protein
MVKSVSCVRRGGSKAAATHRRGAADKHAAPLSVLMAADSFIYLEQPRYNLRVTMRHD